MKKIRKERQASKNPREIKAGNSILANNLVGIKTSPTKNGLIIKQDKIMF
jgi:hypothetical protein